MFLFLTSVDYPMNSPGVSLEAWRITNGSPSEGTRKIAELQARMEEPRTKTRVFF